MKNKESTKEKQTDGILNHFILIGIFLIDAFFKVIDLILPNPTVKDGSEKLNTFLMDKKRLLELKNKEELADILNELRILSELKKEVLVDLILTSNTALKKHEFLERKSELAAKTLKELKPLIAGGEKLTQLKKADIIESILEQEFKLE